MDDVQRTIISRQLLDEYGYDGDKVSDEQLEQIADDIMEYIGVSEHFMTIRSCRRMAYAVHLTANH